MQVVKVEHIDFDLVIECNNIETTFYKAQKKQSQILTDTSYLVNEGKISIYNFESKSLLPLNTDKTYPLIFENKDYFIGITFKNKALVQSPYIYSKLKEVEEKFFFRAEFVDQLRAMALGELPAPELIYALIAQGDEVLDWREMHARYKNCRLRVLPGSDHAISHFELYLNEVLREVGL
jgi:hypothetical protein